MAPSATTEILVPLAKSGVMEQLENHVHGAEDKTPLEAISHGPLVHQGEILFFHFVSLQVFPILLELDERLQLRSSPKLTFSLHLVSQ
jgi:hypothetical protein